MTVIMLWTNLQIIVVDVSGKGTVYKAAKWLLLGFSIHIILSGYLAQAIQLTRLQQWSEELAVAGVLARFVWCLLKAMAKLVKTQILYAVLYLSKGICRFSFFIDPQQNGLPTHSGGSAQNKSSWEGGRLWTSRKGLRLGSWGLVMVMGEDESENYLLNLK